MFAAMADHFVRQLENAKYFYVSQYGQIDRISQKAIKKNQFGALVSLYLRCLSTGDMSFFETESGKGLLKHIESIVKVEKLEGPNSHYYSIHVDKTKIDPRKNELNIQEAMVEFEKASQMLDIHNSNALISLLIRFESFLTDYFEWLIREYPNKYLSEKNIKYSELIKFDFENLQRELTVEAANSIMSQPLDEWLKIIKSHKFDIGILSNYLNEFTEIYYRRNLIVHNNGRVNRQYLAGAKKDETEHPLGEWLVTDKLYVLKSFDVVIIIVYGLLYASLKGNKDDKTEYLEFLFNSGFGHMMKSDWSISAFVFDLLINDDAQEEMEQKLSLINYWISLKNMGRFSEIKDVIENSDFSAMDVTIRLAKEILLENYETAVPLLDEALLTGMTPDMVRTWPLFIQFRKTAYYKEFQCKYAQELESQAINSEELDKSMSPEKTDGLHDIKHSFIDSTDGANENRDGTLDEK